MDVVPYAQLTASQQAVALLVPLVAYLGMFGYPILQYLSIYRMRGRWQIFASLPLVPMAVLLAVAGLSGSGASSGWALLLVLATPLALVYLTLLLVAHRRTRVDAARTPAGGPA
jgi:hypothetical protein